jgi:hypothetical protein
VAGGTRLTIYGGGFTNAPGLAVRFAVENELDEVAAVWISSTRIECLTPHRDSPHAAHVTAGNAIDGSWSGHPLVYVHGSGTFLMFHYDNSRPGCQGCNAGGFQRHLPVAARVRERWTTTTTSGPESGGTVLYISSVGLAANSGEHTAPGNVGAAVDPATVGGDGSIGRDPTLNPKP